jgi:hypothetical protein
LGEESEIGVLRAPGQDLVADDQDAGGDDFGLGVAGRGSLLWLVCARRGVFLGKGAGRHNRRQRLFEDCRAAPERLP